MDEKNTKEPMMMEEGTGDTRRSRMRAGACCLKVSSLSVAPPIFCVPYQFTPGIYTRSDITDNIAML